MGIQLVPSPLVADAVKFIEQTSIFPRIQQYIHDLPSALNLSLIVLITSQISW